MKIKITQQYFHNQYKKYIHEVFINNKEILDKVIINNKLSYFSNNQLLPLYVIYTNGGIEISDETNLNYYFKSPNNLFWLNQFLPHFKKEISQIDTVATIYNVKNLKEYFKFKINFNFDKISINNHKIYSELFFEILDKNKIKIDDLSYAMNYRDRMLNIYNYETLNMSEKLEEFLEERSLYTIRSKKNLIINHDVLKDYTKYKIYFQIKSIKLINLKKNVKFFLFVSDSEVYPQKMWEKQNEKIQHFYKNGRYSFYKEFTKEDYNDNFEIENYSINNLIYDKNNILTLRENENIKIIEFNLRNFQSSEFKPILYVEVYNNTEFEDIILNQNFISNFLNIKQIRNENSNIKEKNNDYDTWEFKETLPKFLIFGSLLELK